MHHADGGKPWLVAPALSSATHQERAGFGAMQRRTVVFAEQGIRNKATRQSQSLRCERIAVGLARWVRIAPTPVERLPSLHSSRMVGSWIHACGRVMLRWEGLDICNLVGPDEGLGCSCPSYTVRYGG